MEEQLHIKAQYKDLNAVQLKDVEIVRAKFYEMYDLDDYMFIDGNYYLDYNTRIEEIEGEEKEKIEKEFFKNYKEED